MTQAKMKATPTPQLEAPHFQEGRALLIAGPRRVYPPGTMNQISTQWQTFAPHIGKIAGQVGGVAYGVCWQAPGKEEPEYLSGVEVSGFTGVPSDFTVVSLAPAKYAVFTHRDHVSKLSETVGAIFFQWLPQSGHVAGGDAETPAFLERYSEEFNPQTGLGGMEVWVPLKS